MNSQREGSGASTEKWRSFKLFSALKSQKKNTWKKRRTAVGFNQHRCQHIMNLQFGCYEVLTKRGPQ